jgi:thiol-disulfide isomerase/thioredoxin
MKRRQLLLGALAALPVKAAKDTAEGADLIGRPAPPLQLKDWINSKPLEIGDLRGKVVLLRWWTQGCPFCQATAPALLSLQTKYGPQGFQVIGIYHPKPAGDWDLNKVRIAAKQKQFDFPVALDGDWVALKRWWMSEDRKWTSVSFLLDKQGVIRYIHPGGEFHEGVEGGLPAHESCNRDLHAIDAKIAQLLTV